MNYFWNFQKFIVYSILRSTVIFCTTNTELYRGVKGCLKTSVSKTGSSHLNNHFMLRLICSLCRYKKLSTIDYSKKPFSKNSYHAENSHWFATNIKRLISIWYEFLLKGLFEQVLEVIEHQTKILLTVKIWKELFRNKLLYISHSAITC